MLVARDVARVFGGHRHAGHQPQPIGVVADDVEGHQLLEIRLRRLGVVEHHREIVGREAIAHVHADPFDDLVFHRRQPERIDRLVGLGQDVQPHHLRGPADLPRPGIDDRQRIRPALLSPKLRGRRSTPDDQRNPEETTTHASIPNRSQTEATGLNLKLV